MKGTYLSKFYLRIKLRRSSKKAVVALARKILVIIYHLLKNKEVYNEDKFEIVRHKIESKRLNRMISEAKKLGYQMIPSEEGL
jgi:hypothetical protein